jgi:peptide/nickel transport system substrate-binding protein
MIERRQAHVRGRIARRRLLGTGGALAAAFLAACRSGDDEDEGAGEATPQAPGVSGVSGATPASQQVKTGGTIKIGIEGEPTSLDPHTGASGGEHPFMYPVYDQLIAYNQKGQLDPETSLAEKWELAEPTRVVLKIRSGITFHDGTAFDAAAVKWNLDRIIDPATRATPRPDLAAIESVEAPSATEVVVRLKEPSAPLLTNFGDRGGMIISRAAFEKAGGKDNYQRAPVGTGPFTIKEWVSDAHMVYERNPSYWRKDAAGQALPYLQTIRLQIIPDITVRVASLESGEIDLSGVAAADVKRLRDDRRFQSTQFVGSSTGIWYVNHAFPPLDNLAFRRALSAAMDRQSYINNFLTGDEPQATGLLTPASWAHDPAIKNYTYDLAKAKEYLQQSGLPPSAWRVKAQPFGATIIQSEEFWQASAKEAGITIEWGQPERDGWRTRVLKGFNADASAGMYVSAWTMRVDPDGNVGQFYTQRGTYNSGQAPTPETEQLVARARQVYDQNERKKLYSEIQAKGVEQLYSMVLLHYNVARIFAGAKVGNLASYYGGEGKARWAFLWI